MRYLEGFTNIGDLYVQGTIDTKIVESIIDILQLFRHNKWHTLLDKNLYTQKVYDRVESMDSWSDLLNSESISINGRKYPSWREIKEILSTESKKITPIPSIVHRDPHLSNAMVCNDIIKLIDPRGVWQNELSIYGDHLYDIAKVSYSIHGKYDWIIRDEFTISKMSTSSFDYRFNPEVDNIALERLFVDKLIDLEYNSFDVRFAEAAISISAAPVFYNSCDQQFILFLKGIETLMEIIE